MNIRGMINEYTECNNFEIKIINNKIKVFYYDNIDHFSDTKIIISKDNKKLLIEGKCLVIETMFEEYLIISGKVKKMILEDLFGE